jgi:hypothetical protein
MLIQRTQKAAPLISGVHGGCTALHFSRIYNHRLRAFMDILTFITKITESIIWPATIISISLIFKEPLTKNLANLLRLRWKELQVEFSQDVEKLKDKADKHQLPSITEDSKIPGLFEKKLKLFELANIYSRAAILEAWTELEAAMGDKMQEFNLLTNGEKCSNKISYENSAKLLFKNEPENYQLFKKLQQIRNKAVHSLEPNPSVKSVCAFIELATRLIGYIKMNKTQQMKD